MPKLRLKASKKFATKSPAKTSPLLGNPSTSACRTRRDAQSKNVSTTSPAARCLPPRDKYDRRRSKHGRNGNRIRLVFEHGVRLTKNRIFRMLWIINHNHRLPDTRLWRIW